VNSPGTIYEASRSEERELLSVIRYLLMAHDSKDPSPQSCLEGEEGHEVLFLGGKIDKVGWTVREELWQDSKQRTPLVMFVRILGVGQTLARGNLDNCAYFCSSAQAQNPG